MTYTYEQITAIHEMLKFLRKIRAVGLVETKVTSITEFGKPRLYKIQLDKYHPGVYKTGMDKAEEALAEMVREAEILGLYDDQ